MHMGYTGYGLVENILTVVEEERLSRFGYCCSELLLRGTSPAPAFTALAPTDLVQPVNTDSAVATTATLMKAR